MAQYFTRRFLSHSTHCGTGDGEREVREKIASGATLRRSHQSNMSNLIFGLSGIFLAARTWLNYKESMEDRSPTLKIALNIARKPGGPLASSKGHMLLVMSNYSMIVVR